MSYLALDLLGGHQGALRKLIVRKTACMKAFRCHSQTCVNGFLILTELVLTFHPALKIFHFGDCYRLNCIPSKFIHWNPKLIVTVFREIFKEVIKLNDIIMLGPKSYRTLPMGERQNQSSFSLHAHTQKRSRGDTGRRHMNKPGREASPETNSDSTLILHFWLPELWENKCLLFKLSRLVVVFYAAWAD